MQQHNVHSINAILPLSSVSSETVVQVIHPDLVQALPSYLPVMPAPRAPMMAYAALGSLQLLGGVPRVVVQPAEQPKAKAPKRKQAPHDGSKGRGAALPVLAVPRPAAFALRDLSASGCLLSLTRIKADT